MMLLIMGNVTAWSGPPLQATVIELVQNICGLNVNINLEDLCMCSPEVTMQIEQCKNLN